MKILIADDESYMRMSLKTSLDWEAYGFQVVGDATHGEDALVKIAELKPDIVLMDIKMPIMDGLQALKKLQDWNDPPKVIILSSYKEFEYVREGMRLGALDYIHKPSLNEAGMFDTLRRAREAIMRERKQTDEMENLRQNAERVKPNMKAVFFKEWSEGAIRHTWEIEEKMKEYDVRLQEPNLVCFALQIDQFSKVRKRYKQDMEYLLYFSIHNILSEVFRKFEEVEFFQHRQNGFAIFKTYSSLRSAQSIYNEQWNLIKTVQNALHKFMNINVSFGISMLHNSLLDVPIALKEAEKVLESNFYDNESGVFFYQAEGSAPGSIKKEDLNKHVFEKKVQHIKQEIEKEQWDRVLVSMERLFEELRQNRQISKQEMLRIATYLHYAFIKACETESDLTIDEFPAIEEFFEAETQQQIYELLVQEAEYVQYKKNLNAASQKMNHKIRMVIDYIHEYYDRDLNLEELSHYVGLNHSYLSRLFKEQTGMVLIQYINQYRVNKSLDLLMNSTMKTYEIAERVGFKSTDNFYIAFKRLIGFPPNEVRKNPELIHESETM
ncbi:response regulator [Paenibacillus sp. sgz500958]|uniref:response regulator transcription factor n=1 Tax=Paenibacillus sp. sgz500958 TaxID=3242475 RepID=UPI0036D20C00